MDEFDLDPTELTGSLISMEFGNGGRIQQLWVSDPDLPDDGEEFQFILPPMNIGDEFAEDYYPGTILLGARTNPDDPWVLSRNTSAQSLGLGGEAAVASFEYTFSLLPEIEAHSKFYEVPGMLPQIVWDFTIRNRGRMSLEIGELAFPFALNNACDGFSLDRMQAAWRDRVHIHKSIAGAASYLHAERMNSEPPGLLIFPGEDTEWEFYSHIRSSLQTPFRWGGIPVVYVYSRAAIEREGWNRWANGHTALILEPGDSKRFQTRMAPTPGYGAEGLIDALRACQRPIVRLLPSAVAPIDLGIGVEMSNVDARRFLADADVELETDADEGEAFCYLKASEPKAVRLSVEDQQGRYSHAHLLFTEPIESLIRKRAAWIAANQVHKDPSGNLHLAILCTNIRNHHRITDPEFFADGFGVFCALADTLFLAEKNTIYPERREIRVLDDTIREFILDDLQNPADYSVGSSFGDGHAVASNPTDPRMYALLANVYHAMSRIAKGYGETERQADQYLTLAGETAAAMFRNADFKQSGVCGVPTLYDLLEIASALEREDLAPLARRIRDGFERLQQAARLWDLPPADRFLGTPTGFEGLLESALRSEERERSDRVIDAIFASRPMSASWWWYGSESRSPSVFDSVFPPIVADKGEQCLATSGVVHAMQYLRSLERHAGPLSDERMRQTLGGLMSLWALIRPDGAAAMSYCPDASSRQFGPQMLTGDSGLAFYAYLRHVTAYVLPEAKSGAATFGCRFEMEPEGGLETYGVSVWDGVGRRIVFREIDVVAECTGGKLKELRVDTRKRRASVQVENPADKDLLATVRVKGLWGHRFDVGGSALRSEEGWLTYRLRVPARQTATTEIRGIE